MDTPFNPSEYKDEFQVKLRELIESKIAGKEIVATVPQPQSNVINLMDALKASVEKQNKMKAPSRRTKGA